MLSTSIMFHLHVTLETASAYRIAKLLKILHIYQGSISKLSRSYLVRDMRLTSLQADSGVWGSGPIACSADSSCGFPLTMGFICLYHHWPISCCAKELALCGYWVERFVCFSPAFASIGYNQPARILHQVILREGRYSDTQ